MNVKVFFGQLAGIHCVAVRQVVIGSLEEMSAMNGINVNILNRRYCSNLAKMSVHTICKGTYPVGDIQVVVNSGILTIQQASYTL